MLSYAHGLRTKVGPIKTYLVLKVLPLLSNFGTSRHLFEANQAGMAMRRRTIARADSALAPVRSVLIVPYWNSSTWEFGSPIPKTVM